MKLTEYLENRLSGLAKGQSLVEFNKKVRRIYGDTYSEKSLLEIGTSQMEIKVEREAGLIKYEPRCGYMGRSHGYSLTASGIKKFIEPSTQSDGGKPPVMQGTGHNSGNYE